MFYLIHLDVIFMFFYSRTYTIQVSLMLVTTYYFAICILTFAGSFVAALAFESPFIRLEKMVMTKLLGGGGKQQKKAQSKISPAVNQEVQARTVLAETTVLTDISTSKEKDTEDSTANQSPDVKEVNITTVSEPSTQ